MEQELLSQIAEYFSATWDTALQNGDQAVDVFAKKLIETLGSKLGGLFFEKARDVFKTKTSPISPKEAQSLLKGVLPRDSASLDELKEILSRIRPECPQGSDFEALLSKHMAKELGKAPSLAQVLCVNADEKPENAQNAARVICRMAIGDQMPDKAVRDLLGVARTELATSAPKDKKTLKPVFAKLLGWLLISAVDGVILAQLLEQDDLQYSIPVETDTGLDIVFARMFFSPAQVQAVEGETDAPGRYRVELNESDFPLTDEAGFALEVSKRIVKQMWSQVFKKEPRQTDLSKEERQDLDSMIKEMYQDPTKHEHYYFVLPRAFSEHQSKIYAQLNNMLRNLPLISFALESDKSLFVVPEKDLKNASKRFLESLNEEYP